MAAYNKTVLTGVGEALANEILAGDGELEFIYMETGSGTYTEDEKEKAAIRKMTVLKETRQRAYFPSMGRKQTDFVLLKASINNAEVEEEYKITEIGIFARKKGTESVVLYGVVTAESADYMPQKSKQIYEIIYSLLAKVYDIENVTIYFTSTTYALAEDLYEHIMDTENIHKVTAKQVGLDKVPNVATNDQTPTFTEASIREDLTSGEKLSILLGIIKKWFADLKEVAFSGSYKDLSDTPTALKNPSALKINGKTYDGSAAVDAGTIGVACGGTGATTVAAARTALGIGSVDNTPDISKPVSTAQQEAIDASYQQATGYTDTEIANLINGAPSTLDTLGEIAAAMAENADVVVALNNAIGTKASAVDFDAHKNNSTIHVTQTDKTNLTEALFHTQSPHVTGVKGSAESTYRKGQVNITAANVGLGNVPNVDTNDQVPTYTEASALAELTSGEKISVAFGKIKLAVKNVKSLVQLIGSTDISGIGNGTVTGAVSALNSNLQILWNAVFPPEKYIIQDGVFTSSPSAFAMSTSTYCTQYSDTASGSYIIQGGLNAGAQDAAINLTAQLGFTCSGYSKCIIKVYGHNTNLNTGYNKLTASTDGIVKINSVNLSLSATEYAVNCTGCDYINISFALSASSHNFSRVFVQKIVLL